MFESMESNRGLHAAKRLLALLISMALHALVILLIVVLPLVFFQLMPEINLLTFLIAAPAPPLPPPPAPPEPAHRASAKKADSRILFGSINTIPDQLPNRIPAPGEEPPPITFSVEILGSGLGIAGGSLADAGGIGSMLRSVAPAVRRRRPRARLAIRP